MNIKPVFLVALLTGVLAIAIYAKNSKTANSKPLDSMPLAPPVQAPVVPVTPTPTVPVSPQKVAPKTVTTYAEAIASAKESGCNIFLYFGAPWCGYCEQMKKTTLVDSEVTQKLSKNFVVLMINTDDDKSIARKFSVRGIPAYMVVNSEGSVLRKTTGYKAKAEFLKWLGDK